MYMCVHVYNVCSMDVTVTLYWEVRRLSWYLSHTCTMYAPWMSRTQCIGEVPYKRKVSGYLYTMCMYMYNVFTMDVSDITQLPYLSQYNIIVILATYSRCIIHVHVYAQTLSSCSYNTNLRCYNSFLHCTVVQGLVCLLHACALYCT